MQEIGVKRVLDSICQTRQAPTIIQKISVLELIMLYKMRASYDNTVSIWFTLEIEVEIESDQQITNRSICILIYKNITVSTVPLLYRL
jgi:hypothetical protein